jgi:hypothetical protein
MFESFLVQIKAVARRKKNTSPRYLFYRHRRVYVDNVIAVCVLLRNYNVIFAVLRTIGSTMEKEKRKKKSSEEQIWLRKKLVWIAHKDAQDCVHLLARLLARG